MVHRMVVVCCMATLLFGESMACVLAEMLWDEVL